MQFFDDVLMRALARVQGDVGGYNGAGELNELLAENGRRDFVRGRVRTMNGEFQLILSNSFHVAGRLSVPHNGILANGGKSGRSRGAELLNERYFPQRSWTRCPVRDSRDLHVSLAAAAISHIARTRVARSHGPRLG